MVILFASRVRVRARAAALVLAAARDDACASSRWLRAEQVGAREECTPSLRVRADAGAVADVDATVDEPPRACQTQTDRRSRRRGDGGTGAVGMWAVGIGRRAVSQRARADSDAVADDNVT